MRRDLSDKIREESKMSRNLREASFDAPWEKSQEIKKEQEYHWKKFNFLKNLNKAMNNEKGSEEK